MSARCHVSISALALRSFAVFVLDLAVMEGRVRFWGGWQVA